MEKNIKFKTQDNKIIYAKINFRETKKDNLIIFVHGLTGGMNEHIFFNAVPYFIDKGFTTLRFDFYASQPQARRMEETTISMHTHDLDTIIDEYKNKYKNIYLVGHSLAGPVIMQSSRLDFIKSIVLWDPTLNFDWAKARYEYNKELGVYFKKSSWYKPLGKAMFDEFQRLEPLDFYKDVQVTTKIIIAGENRYSASVPLLRQVINNKVQIV